MTILDDDRNPLIIPREDIYQCSDRVPKLSEHIHQIVNYEAALIVKKFDPVKLTQGIVILYGILTQETPLPCDRRQQAALRTADQQVPETKFKCPADTSQTQKTYPKYFSDLEK